MKKFKINIVCVMSLAALIVGSLASCVSDDPDAENFYTFTGEMASDFLKNRPEEYSEFTEIVERAGLMDLLSTYGHYTCFVPNNNAVNEYLRSRGMSSVSDLTTADCDTIARTHLVNNMYTTMDMGQDRLPTANLLGRYIATSSGFDDQENAVIYLEGLSHIYFDLADDSVENGIMQPIDKVIEKSNNYISDLLRDNPRISTFYTALVATD
ncbi:MAG: fasciclin domain-containing protein, partial [Prevotella sp.]|nr:fasciclin domain-containing protein [Prevotella sp.]